LIIPLAVYNFFVFTGMAFINTKFFDLSSTYAMSGGALIVLVGVVLLCDGWWSARLIATMASRLQIPSLLPGGQCSHKLKGACQ
jgi:hypothetical protein